MTGAVGFIGLGAMGGPMAERLLRAGFALHVVEPRPEPRERLVTQGATAHPNPVALAEAVELAFACLPTPEISDEVALGPTGVLHGSRLKTYVETSTIGRRAMQAIAGPLTASEIAVLDAPISGGPKGANAGTLAMMVAGAPASIEAARPCLDALASTVVVMGDTPGQAQVMKLVNNLLSAANMAAAFEVMVMGAKAGLDPDRMLEVLNSSTGRNSATEDKLPRAVLPRTFDYGARLDTMCKDLTLGLEEAAALGVPTWTLGAVAQLWRFALTQGGGGQDYTTLIQYIEQWAGAEVRGRAAPAR